MFGSRTARLPADASVGTWVGKAGNCQAVCPKEIPLMKSWGRVNRAATLHVIKKFFDG